MNIQKCLDSLKWCDDIVVLDSFSSDETGEIVQKNGARWIQREYLGRASNQNWAMENIKFKYDWVYYSDADEVMPDKLAKEIIAVTADKTNSFVAYRVRRQDHFMGRWIKRSSGYPLWIVRLFKPDKIRWHRKANPVPTIDGPVGKLKNDYIHYPFSKGITDWFWRHNRYSSYEAEETIRSLKEEKLHINDLFATDKTTRRHALKQLSFRLPLRPIFKFFYLFVVKLSFLDGMPGFHYTMMQCFYEYQIVLKVKEIRQSEKSNKH